MTGGKYGHCPECAFSTGPAQMNLAAVVRVLAATDAAVVAAPVPPEPTDDPRLVAIRKTRQFKAGQAFDVPGSAVESFVIAMLAAADAVDPLPAGSGGTPTTPAAELPTIGGTE